MFSECNLSYQIRLPAGSHSTPIQELYTTISFYVIIKFTLWLSTEIAFVIAFKIHYVYTTLSYTIMIHSQNCELGTGHVELVNIPLCQKGICIKYKHRVTSLQILHEQYV